MTVCQPGHALRTAPCEYAEEDSLSLLQCDGSPTQDWDTAAIDAAAEELDDDPHAAVAIEVSRSFRLRNSLYMEPQGIGLWRDAAIGGARVLMGRVAEQARPSADAKPAN